MKKILYVLVFLFSLFILDDTILAWSKYNIGQEVEYNGVKFYVIKDSSYIYLTMSPWDDSDSYVWCFYDNGMVGMCGVDTNYYVVRPVIVLSKTALGDIDESAIEENDKDGIVEERR